MKRFGLEYLLTGLIVLMINACSSSPAVKKSEVWSKEKANEWYKQKGWQSGCNYIPANAINTIEMWQEESFDPAQIDKELGWAEEMGFSTMRVFLNHLVWKNDPSGFRKRIQKYLEISASHKISAIFVFFDDCWNEESALGKQPAPKTGVHNSGWVQDPARSLRSDTTKLYTELKAYLKDILTEFKADDRVLMWDLYNEPGAGSIDLLKDVYKWAREVNPAQPVTSGINNLEHIDINNFRLENSDVISYHNYGDAQETACWIMFLKQYGRPVFCTEYLRRPFGCNFANILPLLRKHNVAAINWGLVSGKTNTIFGWDDPRPDGMEPKVWFHDILRQDKTPFDPNEIEIIKNINLKKN